MCDGLNRPLDGLVNAPSEPHDPKRNGVSMTCVTAYQGITGNGGEERRNLTFDIRFMAT
jgi:hypothetical protein